MAKKRKRHYALRQIKMPVSSRLEGDRKILFCIDCDVQLVPDWKTSVHAHLSTVKGVPPPSNCKVLFLKRGPKFKYETKESEVGQRGAEEGEGKENQREGVGEEEGGDRSPRQTQYEEESRKGAKRLSKKQSRV